MCDKKHNAIKPTNDYFFGRIFGDRDSKNILIDFLSSILPDLQIKDIKVIKQYYADKNDTKNKFSRMDILATLNDNTVVNIEMQNSNLYNTIDRSIFYICKLLSQNLDSSQDYSELKKTIAIWILNYDLFDEGPYHEICKLTREYKNLLFTDKVEIHYLQLPKFKKVCNKAKTNLEKWLKFILNENIEEIKSMDNKNITDAEYKLEILNADEKEKAIAEWLEDARRNESSVRKYERAMRSGRGQRARKKRRKKRR